jgi:ubiquinone/menaquinone biosynthesis methyltransferase
MNRKIHTMAKRHSRDYLTESHKKRLYNRWLFGIVAKRYTIVTWVLSFGRDSSWKKWLISFLPPGNAPFVIDIASGNGDIAFRLMEKYPHSIVISADLTRTMFGLGRKDRQKTEIKYVLQDMSLLGFKNACADIVTGGYALRNAPDLEKSIAEVRRVLKSGGIAAFLDFSKPPSKIAALIEYVLLKFWGGLWGLVFHGKPEIYGYIAESLRVFPDRPSLHALLSRHGLPVTQSKRFFFGIVEVVICQTQ